MLEMLISLIPALTGLILSTTCLQSTVYILQINSFCTESFEQEAQCRRMLNVRHATVLDIVRFIFSLGETPHNLPPVNGFVC